MKRCLYSGPLLVAVFLLIGSCSSDDTHTEMDQLVGLWQPEKRVEFIRGQGENEIPTDVCGQNDRMHFKANNTFTSETWAERDGACQLLEYHPFGEGIWRKTTEGKYEVIPDVDIPELVIVPSDITFPNAQSLQVWATVDQDAQAGEVTHYYVQYKRVDQ